MTFTLRPYQEKFKRELSVSLAKHKSVIACAPTGSGKSKTFLSIAFGAQAKGRTVLIITESKKIFDQVAAESNAIEIKAGIKYLTVQSGQMYIAMAQTLQSRKFIIDQFNSLLIPPLVIVDEAHIGTMTKLLHAIPNKLLIGFTATPDYRKAKHLPDLYNDCVVCCQVDYLIQEGYLCTYKHKGRDKAKIDLLEMRNGEFTEESQGEVFGAAAVYDGLLEDLAITDYKKCIIFCASIAHCEETLLTLTDAGYNAVQYHSQLKDGSYQLAKFTELGLADICVSVGSLTKGFDYPPIDLIVLLRATTSLPLYLQMMGRASRPYSDYNYDKTVFTVLDYGLHWRRGLGLYWDDRDWANMWKSTKKRKKSDALDVAPVKECPGDNCGCLIPINSMVCPFCGYIFEVDVKEAEIGELVDVTAKYDTLIGRKISSLNPYELSMYAKFKNKKSYCIRIAKAQEQKNAGWLKEYAKNMGYARGWLYHQAESVKNEKFEFYDITIK